MSASPLQDQDAMSEINVTPFVDVLLVLLVIFMVTAPIINHVVQVDLPKDTYNQDKSQPMQEPLRVVVDEEGKVYIGDVLVGISSSSEDQLLFQQKVQEWTATRAKPWLVDLEADEQTMYGALIPVIARLKEVGVSMNLVIQPQARN